jgi:Na+/proline symporter
MSILIKFALLQKQYDIDNNDKFYPVIASLGGFCQALMWTAQGKYFNRSVQLLLQSMNRFDIENLNRSLASTFAFVYFICLCFVFTFWVISEFYDLNSNKILEIFLPIYVVGNLISFRCLSRLDDLGDAGEAWHTFRIQSGIFQMLSGRNL